MIVERLDAMVAQQLAIAGARILTKKSLDIVRCNLRRDRRKAYPLLPDDGW